MPDSPDYQKYLANSVRFSLQDMGELAVRLGSPNIIDRRGEVVMWDDFKHGLSKWTPSVNGGSSAVSITPDGRITSGYRCKLFTDSNAGAYSRIARNFSMIVSGRYGVELIFSVSSSYTSIVVEFEISDNIKVHRVGWKHEYTGGKLYVGFNGIAFTQIAENIAIDTLSDYPVLTKLRVDLDTGKYTSLRFGKEVYDLSTIATGNITFSTIAYSWFRLGLNGNGANSVNVYAESIGLTANEP